MEGKGKGKGREGKEREGKGREGDVIRGISLKRVDQFFTTSIFRNASSLSGSPSKIPPHGT